MKEYTPEYLQHIREVIHAQNIEEARKELEGLHPADIAELYQNLHLKEAEFYMTCSMKILQPRC